MAILSFSSYFSSSIAFLLILHSFLANGNECYTSIISFGDSLADTGNLKAIASQSNDQYNFLLPPYGETFFHRPTGRCSNGRLVIDFIAEGLELPLIPPYMGCNGSERQGMNFAVVSATALNFSFHEDKGVLNPFTNISLEVQLGWFKQYFSSFCAMVPDCRQVIGRSLFLMGEIGGNDYNHELISGKSINQVKTYVPLVINTIISTIHELIDLGATTFIVPGNLPIGCLPVYLTLYYGSAKEEYDNTTGCLIRLNKLSEYHNKLLHVELSQIQKLYPTINFVYADYYNAAMQFYDSPNEFGFTNGGLKACCGGGGPLNYNPLVECGSPSSTVCTQPETYVSWDGLHLTEVAYKLIYKSIFKGRYSTPQFNSLCSILESHETQGLSNSA